MTTYVSGRTPTDSDIQLWLEQDEEALCAAARTAAKAAIEALPSLQEDKYPPAPLPELNGTWQPREDCRRILSGLTGRMDWIESTEWGGHRHGSDQWYRTHATVSLAGSVIANAHWAGKDPAVVPWDLIGSWAALRDQRRETS